MPHVADASVTWPRVNGVDALDYATGKVWHDIHEQTIKRHAVDELIDRRIDQAKLDEWLLEHRWV